MKKVMTLNDYDIPTVLAMDNEADVIDWLEGHGYGVGMIKDAVHEWKHLKHEAAKPAKVEEVKKPVK